MECRLRSTCGHSCFKGVPSPSIWKLLACPPVFSLLVSSKVQACRISLTARATDTTSAGRGDDRYVESIPIILRPDYYDLLKSLSASEYPDSCLPDHLDVIVSRLSALCGPHMPAPCVQIAAAFADLCYMSHPLEIKVKIAHFTALFLATDDLAGKLSGEARETYLEDVRLFQIKFSDSLTYSSLYPGRGDLNPILEDVINYLKSDLNPFFPTHLRLHTLLVKSVLDLMESNLQRQHCIAYPLDCTPEMPDLGFLRRKSGAAEAFACFLITKMSSSSCLDEEGFFYNHVSPFIPEISDALENINDVLSFYKEVDDEEDVECILRLVGSRRLNPQESVSESVEHVVTAKNRVMALVERSPSTELQERVVQLLQGYVSFHVVRGILIQAAIDCAPQLGL